MTRRLIFVRHAESELSARGLVNGDPSVDCPLTEKGRRDAERFRTTIAHEPLDLCITTEFLRTRQTAEILLEGLDIPLEIEPLLDDPPVGVFESRPEKEYVEWLASHDWSVGPPGDGESQLDSVRRFLEAFDRLTNRRRNSILIIGHAFPSGVARTLAHEPPPAIRPHYDCDFDYLDPLTIDPRALKAGIRRARRELLEIEGLPSGDAGNHPATPTRT
jgi:probable phosphoglycerate mutase